MANQFHLIKDSSSEGYILYSSAVTIQDSLGLRGLFFKHKDTN